MSDSKLHGTSVDPSPLEEVGSGAALAVSSALKATLERELAEVASVPVAAAAAPQHLASPGRLRHELR
jgi:hypothetical protein